jgi:HPt (histidine-containing phosphotransfer) domain-containing protein
MNMESILREPLVDQEQMDMLIETGEGAAAELLEELLGLFVGEADPQLAELTTVIAEENRERVGRLAHALAGSSANLGALRLSQIARKIERSAPTATGGELLEWSAYLRSCYKESVELFKTQIASLRAS